MPVIDLGFSQPPTEEDLATFPYGGKVNESTFQVLDFATLSADFRRQRVDAVNEVKVAGVDGHPTSDEEFLRRRRSDLASRLELFVRGAKTLKPICEKRNEIVGFSDRKETLTHAVCSLAKMGSSDKPIVFFS
jgi:hypothetical protein